MADWIFRLFIKEYNNTGNEKVREEYGVLGGWVGICLNVILCAIKMCAGILSKSVSVTGDAFNNLSDALSSLIALIGFKISGKPADKEHPFGHGRIEYVSALFVSVAILLMGAELVRSSFDKIVNEQPIIYTPVSVIILIFSIFVKLWMYYFDRSIAKKIDSHSMLAAARDSLSDSAATLAVIAGIIIFRTTGFHADGYVGLVVAVFILVTGYQTLKSSLTPLLGQAPSKELVDEIEKIVLSHEGIIAIHDLIIHNYGPARFMVSLHAEVDCNDNIVKIHDIIDSAERTLRERFGCDAVIHMDPIAEENSSECEMRENITNIVKKIDEKISIHDFRVIKRENMRVIAFDVLVGFGCAVKDGELKEEIQRRVSEKYGDYTTDIQIDKR